MDESGIEVVFENLDKNKDGKVDKYELAVFFLTVAQYEHLVIEEDIEKHMGFHPSTLWNFILNYFWQILVYT